MVIPKGTLFFRGIDTRPENISNPLSSNHGEKILWLALHSNVAQTYIPDWGGTSYTPMPHNIEDIPRPDDSLITSLMEACGGPVTVTRREWAFDPRYHTETPPERIVNGTVGRPQSWQQTPRATWEQIFTHLRSLGYTPKPDESLPLKTQTKSGKWEVVPANSRLIGTLVIYEAQEDLKGWDKSNGEGVLLDPDYHKAATWALKAAEQGLDFLQIDDFCQTKRHGNVGHQSIGILAAATKKLTVLATLPATHHEWEETPNTEPTEVETAWRKQTLQHA